MHCREAADGGWVQSVGAVGMLWCVWSSDNMPKDSGRAIAIHCVVQTTEKMGVS